MRNYLSLEASEAEGSELEREHVWYGRLKDVSVLDSATEVIHQTQWESPINIGDKRVGSSRVRCVDNDKYFFTTKRFMTVGSNEHTIEVSAEYYDDYKAMCQSGLSKIRYVFPFNYHRDGEDYTLNYEVDRFIMEDGTMHPWVKVDLEIPKEFPDDFVPPEPNMDFEAIVDATYGIADAYAERVKNEVMSEVKHTNKG